LPFYKYDRQIVPSIVPSFSWSCLAKVIPGAAEPYDPIWLNQLNQQIATETRSIRNSIPFLQLSTVSGCKRPVTSSGTASYAIEVGGVGNFQEDGEQRLLSRSRMNTVVEEDFDCESSKNSV
jgi:hypothetical protein